MNLPFPPPFLHCLGCRDGLPYLLRNCIDRRVIAGCSQGSRETRCQFRSKAGSAASQLFAHLLARRIEGALQPNCFRLFAPLGLTKPLTLGDQLRIAKRLAEFP